MTRFIVVVCATLGLSELTSARAQFVAGPLHGPGHGYSSGYSYRTGFGFSFSFSGPHIRGGFSSGFTSRSAFYGSPLVVPVAPFGAFGPVGFAPVPFGPVPPFGFGPSGSGFGVGLGPPVVVIVPPPIILAGNVSKPDLDARPGNVLPRNEPVMLPRGAKETDFLVFAPKKPGTVPEVTRVEPRPAPPIVGGFDPFKPAVKVIAEVPDADPKKEAARLAKLARASFAAEDFGRAGEHFDRAIAANPGDARAYFLHAQVRFAAGQYAEAVARIRAGLERDPAWPKAAFDPAELYTDRTLYAEHLAALKKAVADNPNQATLEFLLGYQLWFSGDKVEAGKLFLAAEKRLAAPGPIALFK